MNKLISLLVLTLAATVAQASPKFLSLVTSVSDAKNVRIIEFKATKVDGDQTQLVHNPDYGCSVDNSSTNCDQAYVSAPVRVPGYEVVIQFDSEKNGDFEIADGGGHGPTKIGTREASFRASELPNFTLPKNKASRLALANSLLQLAATSEVVKSEGAYYCDSTSEGPDENGPTCYAPYSTTQYYINILAR